MKVQLGKKTILMAHPVLIIGSYDKDNRPNIMAVSWGGICCSDPPCIAISLRKATYSYGNIMETRAFTVNIPSEKQISEADYTGIYSGRNENKFESLNLTPVHSEYVNAPYILEFPLNHHCRVINITEIGLHTQFIGEIIETSADEEIMNGKIPDINKVNPFIYDTASRSYYAIKEKLITAYSTLKK